MSRSNDNLRIPTPAPTRPERALVRYAPRRTGTGYGRSSGWASDRQYAANAHRELMSVR
ncbi:MAG: hypothetical protein KF823_01500 [Xanthomonadales bacterium]|nr:hypothetical protein [Xanthomonadales bacterium]